MADPGWYPDPHAPGVLRYFDGQQWTQHVATSQPPGISGQAVPAPPLGITFRATTPGRLIVITALVLLAIFGGLTIYHYAVVAPREQSACNQAAQLATGDPSAHC